MIHMTLKLYRFTDSGGLQLVKPYVPAINISITTRFYTFGSFEIKITLDHFTEFQDNMIVGLDYDFYGIIKNRARDESSSENTATISGFCIKHITQKRECVVLQDENTDILGYDEVSGSTEYCMKHYVDKHIVNPEDSKRKIHNISIAPNYDRGTEDDAYYARFVPISDILNTIGYRAKLGYDFKLNSAGTGFVFDVVVPRNRTVNQSEYQPVLLDIGRGLISRSHAINNEDAANTFYCTRTGYDFEDEAFTQLIYSDGEKTGFEREEHALNISVDSDAEDIYKEFEDNAKKEIEEYETSESIECKLDRRLDIRLGDFVTLISDGVQFDRQLTEIQYTIAGDKCDKVGTFGDKYLTKFERNSREAQKANDVAVNNAKNMKDYTDNPMKYLEGKLPEYDDLLSEVLERMAGSFSYYTWTYAEPIDGWPAGRYISSLPKEKTTKDTEIWLENASGYVHYPNGINGAPDTGMTKDSRIIALFIAAKMVTADAVQTGILRSKDGRCWINLDDGTFHFETGSGQSLEDGVEGPQGPAGPAGPEGPAGTAGRTYFLETSTKAMKRGENASLTPETVTFSGFYRDGIDASRTAYACRYIIAESEDGVDFTNTYTSKDDEESIKYTPTGEAALIRCTMYAAGGTTDALDIATVLILSIDEILDGTKEEFDAKFEELRKYADNIASSASAEISQAQDSISMHATLIETAQNDVLILQQQLETLLDITAGGLQISVSEMQTIIADINGNLTEIMRKLQSYFNFGADGLTIRKSENGEESPYNTFFDNKTIQFRYNETIVAYISNNQLFIASAVVEMLAVGNESYGFITAGFEPDKSFSIKRRLNI